MPHSLHSIQPLNSAGRRKVFLLLLLLDAICSKGPLRALLDIIIAPVRSQRSSRQSDGITFSTFTAGCEQRVKYAVFWRFFVVKIHEMLPMNG